MVKNSEKDVTMFCVCVKQCHSKHTGQPNKRMVVFRTRQF